VTPIPIPIPLPVDLSADELTIDELADAAGTTTRCVRSFQTLGILDHPDLKGRTGHYGPHHRAQLRAILQLQSRGFSLQSLGVLFAAHRRGESLGSVLNLDERIPTGSPVGEEDADEAERYGFAELQRNRSRRRSRTLLAIVPTTVWAEPAAS
jgi:DNA-binding transcriptional MerR regulator